MTGVRYHREILNPCVRPHADAIGSEFILMEDNARPYRARLVDQHLEAKAINECLDWAAQSSDLNPNKHIWNLLAYAV